MPAAVIAGVVIVGELRDVALTPAAHVDRLGDLRQPEVENLDGAVLADLDIRRLQIAVNDPVLVRGLQGVRDLSGDRRIRSRSGL